MVIANSTVTATIENRDRNSEDDGLAEIIVVGDSLDRNSSAISVSRRGYYHSTRLHYDMVDYTTEKRLTVPNATWLPGYPEPNRPATLSVNITNDCNTTQKPGES